MSYDDRADANDLALITPGPEIAEPGQSTIVRSRGVPGVFQPRPLNTWSSFFLRFLRIVLFGFFFVRFVLGLQFAGRTRFAHSAPFGGVI